MRCALGQTTAQSLMAAAMEDDGGAGRSYDLYEGDNDAARTEERLFPVRMTWDERRQLAVDISNLAPPDVAGVLLLLRNFQKTQATAAAVAAATAATAPTPGLVTRELLPQKEPVTPWETQHPQESPLPRTTATKADAIQLECGFCLDDADNALLRQLREYVDECYVPHYVPKENCGICEGLWSCGRVICCGNDACPVRIHEECFGVVLRETEDGPWRCPSCLLGRQLMCSVCMQYGGALKPLATPALPNSTSADELLEQKWVHTLCAMAIPELVMRDVPTMEPVDGWEEIENGRFRYLCAICRKRGGASIICEQDNCNVGLHPQCAATAGLMIGNEGNLLGVYCEKHLPNDRIPGAKRWISDEDLVEEIMSEYSIEDDLNDDTGCLYSPHGHHSDAERFAFVLESTPYLHCKQKLLGPTATLHFGPAPFASRVPGVKDLDEKMMAGAKVNANAYAAPAMVVQGMSTQRPLVFPPSTAEPRLGLPTFPQKDAAVGAIVDYLAKEQEDWQRARVLQWDAEKKMHLVQLVASGKKLWTQLSTANTLVLYLPDEENVVDGPRVKLVRPVRRGTVEWRPKPRQFAPAS